MASPNALTLARPSTTLYLQLTASAFHSFATPAITVPFPSVYAATQIPFSYPATPTWTATRILTTIGGIPATSGISSADSDSGTKYGQSSNDPAPASHTWPTWAIATIAGCAAAACLVLALGIFCWCTRTGRRGRQRHAAAANDRRRNAFASEKTLGHRRLRSHGDARPPRENYSRHSRSRSAAANEKKHTSFFGVSGLPPPARDGPAHTPDSFVPPIPQRIRHPSPSPHRFPPQRTDTDSPRRHAERAYAAAADPGSGYDSPSHLLRHSDSLLRHSDSLPRDSDSFLRALASTAQSTPAGRRAARASSHSRAERGRMHGRMHGRMMSDSSVASQSSPDRADGRRPPDTLPMQVLKGAAGSEGRCSF